MSKNSNITSFFRPVPKGQSSSQLSEPRPPRTPKPARQNIAVSDCAFRSPVPSESIPTGRPSPSPARQPRSSLSPLLPHLVSPPSKQSPAPPKATPKARDRYAEIQDSEDDEDFISSDDDLPVLFKKTGPAPAPVPVPRPRPPPENKLLATPRAKRTAVEFFSSPLTVNTRHKFDMKALRKHAEADQAVEDSERQYLDTVLAHESATTEAGGTKPNLGKTLRDVLLSDAENSHEENNREKLLVAVQRTAESSQRPEWRFFDENNLPGETSVTVRFAFPSHAVAEGAWAFLAPEKTRSEFFEEGLPYQIQQRLQSLPDDVFLWVLNETPFEKSRKLRDEYLRLLSACPDHTKRLVDPSLISKMFVAAGASERALKTTLEPNDEAASVGRYSERDWTPLQFVLRTLQAIGRGLDVPSLTQAADMLLRLGIDQIVLDDQSIACSYQDAFAVLTQFVPRRAWDTFCGGLCSSLHTFTPLAVYRCNAITAIPILSSRLIDLRRRLALSSIFNDPSLALSPPSETFTVESLLDHLDAADEFTIDRNNTDYVALGALSHMLIFAVGDGNQPTPSDDPEATRKFNKDIDELTRHVMAMWSNIHGQGAAQMTELEVRSLLKDFERKLQYAVRTRPPPRENIFGTRAGGGDEYEAEEVELPRQQKFMERFLAKKAARESSV